MYSLKGTFRRFDFTGFNCCCRYIALYFSAQIQGSGPRNTAAFKKDLTQLEEKQNDSSARQEKKHREIDHPSTAALFKFNPNTLNREGWQQLGVPDKVITTIEKYKSKGRRFYKPEYLGKIYGLRKELVERLLPYVVLEKPVATVDHAAAAEPVKNSCCEFATYSR